MTNLLERYKRSTHENYCGISLENPVCVFAKEVHGKKKMKGRYKIVVGHLLAVILIHILGFSSSHFFK